MKGKFITFEGIEGAGKSTVIQAVGEYLDANNIQHIITREPGGSEIGNAIRNILLSSNQQNFSHKTELLLIFAARAQHIEEVILPSINNGVWVLCDRFIDSTLAYQGAGRGICQKQIMDLYNLTCDQIEIDGTILLDVPEDVGITRACGERSPDRFERETQEFFSRVRKQYLQLAAKHQRIVCIDAMQEQSDVVEQVICQIKKYH